MSWFNLEIRGDIAVNPDVFELKRKFRLDLDATIGKIVHIWSACACTANEHGVCLRVSEEKLDAAVGVAGFTKELDRLEWLKILSWGAVRLQPKAGIRLVSWRPS